MIYFGKLYQRPYCLSDCLECLFFIKVRTIRMPPRLPSSTFELVILLLCLLCAIY